MDEMQVGEVEAKVEAVELLKLLQGMVLLVMMGLQLKRDGEDQELLWLLVKVLFLREVGPGDEAEESSSIDTFIMSLLWVVALEFVSFLLLLGKGFYDLNLSAKRHRVFALSVAMWQRRKLSYSAEFWIFKRREVSIATSRVKSELSFCLLASFNLRAILLVAFPFIHCTCSPIQLHNYGDSKLLHLCFFSRTEGASRNCILCFHVNCYLSSPFYRSHSAFNIKF
jgi:hypothetical protein